jgi:hypothetical protein
MLTASCIICTKISGGLSPNQMAADSNRYWDNDSHGFILGILLSSISETGRKIILRIFFPKA